MKRTFLTPALMVMLGTFAMTFIVRAGALAAHQGINPANSDRAAAEQIISQLDDADPEVRRIAALRLNSMGGGALEVVEAALKSSDLTPEARVRLNSSLRYVAPRANLERVHAERNKWLSNLFHHAYRDGGHTAPEFDDQAHVAIDLYLALGLDPLHAASELHAQTMEAFSTLAHAGCVDPMMLALARLADGQPDRTRVVPMRTGADALMYGCYMGHYPPVVKFHVWSILCSWRYRKDDIVILRNLLEAALATPDVPASVIDELLRLIPNSTYRMSLPEWQSVIESYEQLAPRAPGPMMIRANLAEEAAKAYRSATFDAKTVDADHKRRYCQMLHEACDLADKAYERDPMAPEPPSFALRVLNVLSNFEDTRYASDVWFKRAIAANPDDSTSYEMKIKTDLSRGRSTVEEVLAFGRECTQRQNWRGGVALTIVAAHENVANLKEDRQEYFAAPAVWDDMRSAYEGCLINFPDDLGRRCEYAKYATICGRWVVANEQFKVIGDKPVLSVFGSQTSYAYLRGKAARLVAEKPTNK